MKAIVCTKYGAPDVLQLRELDKPSPRDNEVLIKMYATSVAAGDCRIRGLLVPPLYKFLVQVIFGFGKPRQPVLGFEFSGEIESIGRNVTKFKKGDLVYGSAGFKFGCYAEFKCMPEDGTIALKPSNLAFEEASAVPVGAMTALFLLRDKAKISPGEKVLVYGASGSVGTYAVQLAKHFQAEVTGVCSTSNLEMVKSLGADAVIDYTEEDFTKSGLTYDIIIDAVGKCPLSRCKNSLSENGSFASSDFMQPSKDRGKDMVFLKELIEAGNIKPVIDRSYPLEEIAVAHSYVDSGHKKGNVVITVRGSD